MQEFILAGVKKNILREFIFKDGPENYFSREFNFANYLYFPRNRENFFPRIFLPINPYFLSERIICSTFCFSKGIYTQFYIHSSTFI